MNKRGKALVFVGVLLILLVLVAIPFVLSAQNDFSTTCYNEKHSIINHEITCEIQNNLQSSINHKVGIDLNLQKGKTNNVEIYEFAAKTKEVPAYETQCNPYDEETTNGTKHYENCEQVQTGTKTVSYEDLEKLTANPDSEKIKWSAGEKQFNSKEKRKFLIKWQTPIEKTNNGWGSSGNWKINPEGWWNESWNRRINISVEETGGVARINEIADVWANYTTGNCSKEYRVTGWNASGNVFELTSQVYNETYISGYCTSANVLFMVNLTANEHKNYTLYFNNSVASEPSYSYLVQSHPTEINSDFPARTMLFNISLGNSMGQFNWYDSVVLRNFTTTKNVIGITSHITIYNAQTLKFCNLSSVIDVKGALMVQTAKISAPCNVTLRIYPYYVEWTVKNDPSMPIYIGTTSWNDGEYATDRNFDYAFFGNETLYTTGAWNENGLSKNKTYIFSFENISQNGVVIVYQNVSAKFGMRWYVADGTCFRVGVDGNNCGAYTSGTPDITNTSFRLRATFNNNFSDAGWQVARDERIKMENPLTYSFGKEESYVINTPPTHTQPLLSSTYGTNFRYENLTCYNQSTKDIDNDPVTNIYNWYKNSQPIAVLNMPFEGGSNETYTKDYSTKNNNGIVSGATWNSATGKIGGAYEFDGVNDYIEIPYSNSLATDNEMTAEAWVKFDSVNGGRIVLKSYYRGWLLTYTANKFSFGGYILGDTWRYASYSTIPTVNEWYYVVGTLKDNTLKVYINGIKMGEYSTTAGFEPESYQVEIGNSIRWGESFNGTIDEVRIYSYALTPEQIKQRYQDTKDGITKNSTIVSQETNPGDTWMCQVSPNDGQVDGAILNSSDLDVVWAITFNVTSGEDGSQITNFDISCDNDWSVSGVSSPYPAGFLPGSFVCVFEKATYPYFYDKTITFTADNDKTVDVVMSYHAYLTIEEHTWIEAIYTCLYEGDCHALNLLSNINQTTIKIWNQFKRTDQAVITSEEVTNYIISATSNLSIDYIVNVPTKEGYSIVEGIQGYDDFLPIRISYWFLDSSNTNCYSQGEKPTGVETPYCNPLIVQTVGQINTEVNFTVELRPNLPVGNYTIVRSIEIDPKGVWMDYGQEIIGNLIVLENSDKATSNLKYTGAIPNIIKDLTTKAGITGSVIGTTKEFFTNNQWFILILAGMICITIISYSYFKYSKKK
ncbi:MAG: LamG domain-containing protein [Nanoarchaeota archaeon]|nr:LamG domain-containing protein [Nanoarchaeota archaeon]